MHAPTLKPGSLKTSNFQGQCKLIHEESGLDAHEHGELAYGIPAAATEPPLPVAAK